MFNIQHAIISCFNSIITLYFIFIFINYAFSFANKNTEGDATSSENYRGITLSHVISKLFESLIIESCNILLHSDVLQFGFKENSSCTNAINILCTVVEYFCNNEYTVNTCALDISKAFDRVDQYALLNTNNW